MATEKNKQKKDENESIKNPATREYSKDNASRKKVATKVKENVKK